MNTQTMPTWLAVLIIIAVVLLGVWLFNRDVDVMTDTATDSEATTEDDFVNVYNPGVNDAPPVTPSSNAFDKKTVQVGDVVAGMKVVSVDGRRVSFFGRAQVTGTISDEELMGIFFTLSEESMEVLPQVVGTELRKGFCLRGGTAAEALAQYPQTEIKILIKDYITDTLEGETCDSAILVEVVGVK